MSALTPSPSAAMSRRPSSAGASGGTSGGVDGPLNLTDFIQKIHRQREDLRLVLNFVLDGLRGLANLLSYPALLTRWGLGSRTLSGTAFLASWSVLALVAVTSGIAPAYLCVMLLPVLYGTHYVVAERRSRRGERRYSYCRGDSWFDLVLRNRSALNRGWVEPLALVVLGTTVYFFGSAFSVDGLLPGRSVATESVTHAPEVFAAYLAAMGVALFFVEARLRKQDHDTLLDHIDQQIISKYLSDTLSDGDTPVAQEGFAIAELADWTPQQRGVLTGTYGAPGRPGNPGGHLDPAWDNLLDPDPGR